MLFLRFAFSCPASGTGHDAPENICKYNGSENVETMGPKMRNSGSENGFREKTGPKM